MLDTHLWCPPIPRMRPLHLNYTHHLRIRAAKQSAGRTNVGAPAARDDYISYKARPKGLESHHASGCTKPMQGAFPSSLKTQLTGALATQKRIYVLMPLLLVLMSIFFTAGAIVYASCRSQQRRRDRRMHRHIGPNSLSSRPRVQLPRRRAF